MENNTKKKIGFIGAIVAIIILLLSLLSCGDKTKKEEDNTPPVEDDNSSRDVTDQLGTINFKDGDTYQSSDLKYTYYDSEESVVTPPADPTLVAYTAHVDTDAAQKILEALNLPADQKFVMQGGVSVTNNGGRDGDSLWFSWSPENGYKINKTDMTNGHYPIPQVAVESVLRTNDAVESVFTEDGWDRIDWLGNNWTPDVYIYSYIPEGDYVVLGAAFAAEDIYPAPSITNIYPAGWHEAGNKTYSPFDITKESPVYYDGSGTHYDHIDIWA